LRKDPWRRRPPGGAEAAADGTRNARRVRAGCVAAAVEARLDLPAYASLLAAQVDGCHIFIREDVVRRAYNLRCRICETHLRAAAVQHQGQLQRFCQARLIARPLLRQCHADAASCAQKCSRFHPLSAYTGDMRTCAAKLLLQWERRREQLIASGGVPRGRGVALLIARAAAAASADATAEAEGGGNGDETTMTTMTQGEAAALSVSADGQGIGFEQGAGADAVPEAAPEPQTAAAARAAARAARAAAASALGILATQA